MAHIERETLEKLYHGELPLEEQVEVLEHISTCDYCSGAFANIVEEMTLMRAPSNLKSSILKQAGELPIQLETKHHVLSKKLQLMFYSMKIGVAACFAIVMIFMANTTVIQSQHTAADLKLNKMTTATDKFTQSVNDITNQFMHGEVLYHD